MRVNNETADDLPGDVEELIPFHHEEKALYNLEINAVKKAEVLVSSYPDAHAENVDGNWYVVYTRWQRNHYVDVISMEQLQTLLQTHSRIYVQWDGESMVFKWRYDD